MTYLLSALAAIIIGASWALILIVITAAHHRGMSRVRRAQSRWAQDYVNSREHAGRTRY